MKKYILSIILILFVKFLFAQNYDKTIKGYLIAEFHPNKETSLDQNEKRLVQQKHMQYIKTLAEDKKLVLAGPYLQGGGLFVLNTTNEEEAKTWIENDPTIQNGVNTYTLKKWFTERGLFTLDNLDWEFKSRYGKLNSGAPKETIQYGQLVGKWDIDVSNLTQEGKWFNEKAEWTFIYILDGYAIQDFWTRPSQQNFKESKDYLGTNIRIFNPELGKWKCTWVQNGNNDLNGVWTSYQNDAGELILHDDSKKWQITFFNISDNSFEWKWDFKQDDGTLQTRVRIKAKRIE